MKISYTKQGDYLLPNLTLKVTRQYIIGKYGLLGLDILKTCSCYMQGLLYFS